LVKTLRVRAISILVRLTMTQRVSQHRHVLIVKRSKRRLLSFFKRSSKSRNQDHRTPRSAKIYKKVIRWTIMLKKTMILILKILSKMSIKRVTKTRTIQKKTSIFI
jgi:hypothetical protein